MCSRSVVLSASTCFVRNSLVALLEALCARDLLFSLPVRIGHFEFANRARFLAC